MMDNVTALQQNSQKFTSFTCRYGLITFYCIMAENDNIIHLTFAQEKHQRAVKLLADAKQTIQKGKHEKFPFSPVFEDYFTGGEYQRADQTEVLVSNDPTDNKDLWYGLLKQWENECDKIKSRIIQQSSPSGSKMTRKSSGKAEEEYIDELKNLGYAY